MRACQKEILSGSKRLVNGLRPIEKSRIKRKIKIKTKSKSTSRSKIRKLFVGRKLARKTSFYTNKIESDL
jgi:hypothetical protein